MDNLINAANLRDFAYVNDETITKPVRGAIVEFMGLNGNAMYEEDTPRGLHLAKEGILLIIPYLNPWNWMNEAAVSMTDAILDAAFTKHHLPEDAPVVCTGGSMGGLCAIVYSAYASRRPAACVTNCPVTDLPYHYTERKDLPRTLVSAFGLMGEEQLNAAMRAHSPLHLAERLPRIPYTVFHCEADSMVNIALHADKFVEAMRAGQDIEYIRVPGRDHCDLDEVSLSAYHFAAEAPILRLQADWVSLRKNCIALVQEFQVKLGQSADPITLYYPVESLNRLLGVDLGAQQLCELIEGHEDEETGRLKARAEEDLISLTISGQAVGRIEQAHPAGAFLREFIALISRHGTGIEDFLALFARHAATYTARRIDTAEFDYLLYFDEGEPDDFRYALKFDGPHATYHRFTPEDYNALGFPEGVSING